MFGDKNALPCSERKRSINYRDVEGYTSQHRFDVSRHIIRPLDLMYPGGVRGREPPQPGMADAPLSRPQGRVVQLGHA